MLFTVVTLGAGPTVYLAVACFLAYMASGHPSIYLSQRVGIAKRAAALVPPDIPLRDLRQMQSAESGERTARVVSLAALRSSTRPAAPSHHVHFGHSNHGGVEVHAVEVANPSLTMCAELFCREHGPLLERKVVTYKELEQWRVARHGLADEVPEAALSSAVA